MRFCIAFQSQDQIIDSHVIAFLNRLQYSSETCTENENKKIIVKQLQNDEDIQ